MTNEAVSVSELSAEDLVAKVQEAHRKGAERRAEASRRRKMEVKVPSGLCVCGGRVTYRSTMRFQSTEDASNPRYGAPVSGHMVETVSTTCETCALIYDKSHSRFDEAREITAKQRKPPDENEKF